MYKRSPVWCNGLTIIAPMGYSHINMANVDSSTFRHFFFADPHTLEMLGADDDSPHILAAMVGGYGTAILPSDMARLILLNGAECDIPPSDEIMAKVAAEIEAERIEAEANRIKCEAFMLRYNKNRTVLEAMMDSDRLALAKNAEAIARWIDDNTPIQDRWTGEKPEEFTVSTVIDGIEINALCTPSYDDNTEWVAAPSRWGGGYVAGSVIGIWKISTTMRIDGRLSTIKVQFGLRSTGFNSRPAVEMEIDGDAFASHDDFLEANEAQIVMLEA